MIWGRHQNLPRFLREEAPFLMVPARKRPFALVVRVVEMVAGKIGHRDVSEAVRVTVTASWKWNPAFADLATVAAPS